MQHGHLVGVNLDLQAVPQADDAAATPLHMAQRAVQHHGSPRSLDARRRQVHRDACVGAELALLEGLGLDLAVGHHVAALPRAFVARIVAFRLQERCALTAHVLRLALHPGRGQG